MGHALEYLKLLLTPEQYQTYREHAAVDSRDSYARQKWKSFQRWGDRRTGKTARKWLLERSYIDEAGNWTGLTWK